MALDVLFEDDEVLVLNKPPGVSTQAPAGIDSLERQVRGYLTPALVGDDSSPPIQTKPIYLGLPHRLDRPVSGVIIFAKTKKAARKLSKQFERRRVRKLYWAAVEGIVEPVEGQWVDTLRKVPHEARVEVVDADHPEGQQAILNYRTIRQGSLGSVLEIELHTGRMHQIRVQTASRGWPIVGDAQYGSSQPFGEQFEDVRRRAIALHARKLSIALPGSQEPTTFEAPMGSEWGEWARF